MYKVILRKQGKIQQEIICETKKEAEKTAYELRSAFPAAIKSGQISVYIAEY